MPISIISIWKLEVAIATKAHRQRQQKIKIYVEVNMYAKFQFHPPYGRIFFFFRKFSLSAAMATNQNQRLGQKIHMVGRGLLQKHFCKTFFKISAVTQK